MCQIERTKNKSALSLPSTIRVNAQSKVLAIVPTIAKKNLK